jgi:hypothetical protein
MSTKHCAVLFAVAGLLVHQSSCLAALYAWDNADDVNYSKAIQFGPDQNGGYGFAPWVDLKYRAEVGQSFWVTRPATAESPVDGEYSWGMGGNMALGRGLLQPLATGTWTFLAAHYVYELPFGAMFSGFILKTGSAEFNDDNVLGDEAFRFGFNCSAGPDFDRGICYSISGDSDYQYVGGDEWGLDSVNGCTLEYSVSWRPSGADTVFALSIVNKDNDTTLTVDPIFVPSNKSIAMLATVVHGGNPGYQTVVFDAFSVPEPSAAMPVLALTALGLALYRKARARVLQGNAPDWGQGTSSIH